MGKAWDSARPPARPPANPQPRKPANPQTRSPARPSGRPNSRGRKLLVHQTRITRVARRLRRRMRPSGCETRSTRCAQSWDSETRGLGPSECNCNVAYDAVNKATSALDRTVKIIAAGYSRRYPLAVPYAPALSRIPLSWQRPLPPQRFISCSVSSPPTCSVPLLHLRRVERFGRVVQLLHLPLHTAVTH